MNNEDKQTLDVSGGTGMPLETLNWHETALKQEWPSNIEFRKSGDWVMRITADRRIEVNEGIDVTEAAKHVLEALQKLMGPKPWVGLEAADLAQIETDAFWQVGNHMAIALAVEEKLKEKNT